MTTYFVTGGEGFIGYHLCTELLKNQENIVISYDVLKHVIPLTESNWCFYQNYRVKCLQNSRLIRGRGDVNSRGLLKETLEKYRPEIMFHLAGLSIANVSHTHPEEAFHDLFMATMTLIDVIRNLSYKINRFIYISSSMVYGDFKRDSLGSILPAVESWECNPKCIYGGMKLCGETLVKVYNQRFGLPFVIIRPSAVYGPTDSNRRVTELFLMDSLTGGEFVLDNGGLHQLDFTYVKDLIQGLILASTSKKALGQTFNITRGEGRTIKELAEILMKLNPDPGCKLVIKNVSVYRPNRGTLNISKAKNLLGYEPKYSLEDGMKEYIEFVKSTLLNSNKR